MTISDIELERHEKYFNNFVILVLEHQSLNAMLSAEEREFYEFCIEKVKNWQ